ncbi:hypothetical protein AERO9AM_130006 [Aeromicrobium sp. 9AM]|nr:hypothetical protein AERO9AM_130006 [Aeromicrobium sp. 9AM]
MVARSHWKERQPRFCFVCRNAFQYQEHS